MPKKPDLYKRAKGYGRLADIKRDAERELDWRPIPGFPQYQVNKNRQVRRETTGARIQPYKYMLRPNEGEFVDFHISGQRHTISLDTIMNAVFKEKEVA